MSSQAKVVHWAIRYTRLKRSLPKIGYILPGSVVKRFMPCGKSSCRCAEGTHHHHGPYYQWSVALRGKPVAVRLTPPEARLYRGWIENNRKLRKIIGEMRKISMRVAEYQGKTMRRR